VNPVHTNGAGYLIAVLFVAGLLVMFWRPVFMLIVTSMLAVFLVGLAEIVTRLRGGP